MTSSWRKNWLTAVASGSLALAGMGFTVAAPVAAVTQPVFAAGVTCSSGLPADELQVTINGQPVALALPSGMAAGSYTIALSTTVSGLPALLPAVPFSVDASGCAALVITPPPVSTGAPSQITTGLADPLNLGSSAEAQQVGPAVLLGQTADLTATVSDANGNPVPGVTVDFINLSPYGPANDSPEFVATGSSTASAVTNAQGVATAAMAATNGGGQTAAQFANDSNNAVGQLYEVNVDGTQVETTGTVAFVAIGEPQLTVSNSSSSPISEGTTNPQDQTWYAPAQTVSANGSAANAVGMNAQAYFVVPVQSATNGGTSTVSWPNGNTGSYGPYAQDVSGPVSLPDNLQTATINVASLGLSEGSTLTVYAVPSWASAQYAQDGQLFWITHGWSRVVQRFSAASGPVANSNFGIQVSSNDAGLDLWFVLQAPGQVQPSAATGINIPSVSETVGALGSSGTASIPAPNAQTTWSSQALQYTAWEPLSQAISQVQAETGWWWWVSEASYVGGAATYYPNYTYQVKFPVFPEVGNAIIEGTDQNGVVQQYFFAPTQDLNGDGVNVLDLDGSPALATANEVSQAVGTVSGSPSPTASVNSTTTGYSEVQAVVSIPGVPSNLTLPADNTLYSFVQWTPLQNSSAAPPTQQYALVGQSVTLTAQLLDANGNPVPLSNQPVDWSYSDPGNGVQPITGPSDPLSSDVPVSVTSLSTETNPSGQASISVVSTTAEPAGQLAGLVAQSPGYTVLLSDAGGSNLSSVTVDWESLGLQYGPSPFGTPFTSASPVNITATEGTPQAFGVQVFDPRGLTVAGVPVNVAQASGGVGTLSTPSTGFDAQTGFETTTFNAASTKTGSETAQVTIHDPTGNAITFTDASGTTYADVGSGTAGVNTELDLAITWQPASPFAAQFTSGDQASAGGSNPVTLSVTDVNGNPVPGEYVSLTLTNSAGGTATLGSYSGTTDANGVFATALSNGTLGEIDNIAATISETVGGPSVGTAAENVTWGQPVVTVSAPSPATVGKDVTVTVKVTNLSGNPVTGENVNVTVTGGAATVSPTSGATDGTGTFSTTLSGGTSGETDTITATAQSTSSTATVTWQ